MRNCQNCAHWYRMMERKTQLCDMGHSHEVPGQSPARYGQCYNQDLWSALNDYDLTQDSATPSVTTLEDFGCKYFKEPQCQATEK